MVTYNKGALGKVVSNGQNLTVTKWEVSEEADEIEVTNTSSGGVDEFLTGTVKTSVSVDCVHDSDNLPNAATPDINAGSSITCAVHIANTGKTWSGTVKIMKVTHTSEVKGRVDYSFEGKFSGTVTKPS